MTYSEIRNNEEINTYIRMADSCLSAIGYTEHSFAHVGYVANKTGDLLTILGYPERTAELGRIAGYLHDIGNLVNRVNHGHSGAILAFRILEKNGFPPEEIAAVVAAIGNHDESDGSPVSPITAALMLADKSDVRRNRVRNLDISSFDIHDRVNYSVGQSELSVSADHSCVTLKLTVDTRFSSVMEYFEIFLDRMKLCRRAAEKLGLRFRLVVNGQQME